MLFVFQSEKTYRSSELPRIFKTTWKHQLYFRNIYEILTIGNYQNIHRNDLVYDYLLLPVCMENRSLALQELIKGGASINQILEQQWFYNYAA